MELGFNLNQILASQLPEELVRMSADFEPVTLHVNQTLFRYGEAVDYVFFPLTSVTSLLCLLESGKNVEIGLVGSEGIIGLPKIIGSDNAIYTAEVLIPGQAIKVRAEVLKTCFARNEPVGQQLMRYFLSLLIQFSQLSACNLCHHIPERVCRWLLMLQDRAVRNEFELTHEQIAERLGIRRSGITVQLGLLEESGAIQASRGRIKIIDRSKLEEASCECYRCLAEESRSASTQTFAAKAGVNGANQWWPAMQQNGHKQPFQSTGPASLSDAKTGHRQPSDSTVCGSDCSYP